MTIERLLLWQETFIAAGLKGRLEVDAFSDTKHASLKLHAVDPDDLLKFCRALASDHELVKSLAVEKR